MEEDRAQVDLGIAADIEAAQFPESTIPAPAPAQTAESSTPPLKQPKKRFIGRRAADAAAKSDQNASGAASERTDVQSMRIFPVVFPAASPGSFH